MVGYQLNLANNNKMIHKGKGSITDLKPLEF